MINQKVLLLLLVIFSSFTIVKAQKTVDELKAERDVIKTEQKSETFQNRQKTIQELLKNTPPSVSVSSIDALAQNSRTSLQSVNDINNQLPDLYKRTIGETIDGVTDVTVKKPSMTELLSVSERIVTLTTSVSSETANIVKAQGDLKNVKPLQMSKAKKSVDYSVSANTAVTNELAYQTKLVNNLIGTLKSSGGQ